MDRVTASASSLYSSDNLPSKFDCRGAVFLDADKTFLFNGFSPPPNWRSSNDELPGYFRYLPQCDEYIHATGCEDYDEILERIPEIIRPTTPAEYMSVFQIKRCGSTFFIARFTEDKPPIPRAGQEIALKINDIIIPEPHALLLTGHILLKNKIWFELGTQRLCISPSHDNRVHPGLIRLWRALNVAFRSDRLFLRDNFILQVLYKHAENIGAAKQLQAAVNDKANPSKWPLCDLLVGCLKKEFPNTNIPKVVLVDDDECYQPRLGEAPANFSFVKAEPKDGDVCHPLRSALLAMGITNVEIDKTLALIRAQARGDGDITEVHIQFFRSYVLQDLAISLGRLKARANLFSNAKTGDGRVYAIAASQTEVLVVHRESVPTIVHMQKIEPPWKYVDVSKLKRKYFAANAYRDNVNFLLAGRADKPNDAFFHHVDYLGVTHSENRFDNVGTVLKVAPVKFLEAMCCFALSHDKKAKRVKFAFVNFERASWSELGSYPLKLHAEDSTNIKHCAISAVELPSDVTPAAVAVSLLHAETPLVFSFVNMMGNPSPQIFTLQGLGHEGNLTEAVFTHCQFFGMQQLFVTYVFPRKIVYSFIKIDYKKKRAELEKKGQFDLPGGHEFRTLCISPNGKIAAILTRNNKVYILSYCTQSLQTEEPSLVNQCYGLIDSCRFIRTGVKEWQLIYSDSGVMHCCPLVF